MNKNGDIQAFDRNWKKRKEAVYNHWTRGETKNQIQLAFRNHWEIYKEILKNTNGKRCLEVGCGRGSVSSYFADNGYKCTLVDYSQRVLSIAKRIFDTNAHKADFLCGDVNRLPLESDSFDVVVSIGLLEHFEGIREPLEEQVRVLGVGGIMLAYIVPGSRARIQNFFNWVNFILKQLIKFSGKRNKSSEAKKEDIFRNRYGSKTYINYLRDMQMEDIMVSGMYPLPMISYSPEFPFTLLDPFWENLLVKVFKMILLIRKILFKNHPWICKEKTGQAFLLVCRKRRDDNNG